MMMDMKQGVVIGYLLGPRATAFVKAAMTLTVEI
jgi:hypothetical protein